MYRPKRQPTLVIVRKPPYNYLDVCYVTSLTNLQGGDVNAKDKKNMLPLHHACWKGQRDAAQYLLDNGAQIAEVDSSLKTPLHWAVQFGHYETLVTLLEVSAGSGLHWAVQFGHYETLVTLLEVSAGSGLHWAVQFGHYETLVTLLEVSAGSGLHWAEIGRAHV